MSSFQNNQVDIAMLPNWESLDFQQVSNRYKMVVFINYFILILSVLGLLVFIAVINDAAEYTIYYRVGIALSVFLVCLCGISIWSINYWGYALREHDVVFKSGIFKRNVHIVPYKHIQHVDIKEGLLSRLFALSSVEVFTAGAGKSLALPGLEKAIGMQIQQYISSRISDKA